nr:LPSOT [Salix linearistipularis]
MAWTRRFGMLMLQLFLLSPPTLVYSRGDDFFDCKGTVTSWAESAIDNEIKENKSTLKDMLFFLHIPRTGGRTYYHCILRKLYNGSQECPRSYDKLRFDPSKPDCRLMVTHDDYSLMSKLPKERTSVVTVLRNPVDRVFSMYEFSIEVAARFLVHPNLTSATQMSQRLRLKSRGVSTLDIWPWKYLVPWMREDLFNRRATRIQEVGEIKERNSYDIEEMAMPLHVFIDDPVAHDIVHNGATFQVAGLTNNSYSAESHKVRHCVSRHPTLGRYVLDVAKNILDHMLYVGLTEDHKNSATMFANMVGAQVLSQSEALGPHLDQEASNKTEQRFSFPDSEVEGSNQARHSDDGEQASPTNSEAKVGYRTVGELIEAYEVCVPSLRKSQATRRTSSLRRIAPASFSKEARLLVPKPVIQKIVSLNSLDVELYRYAQDIFSQQQEHLIKDSVGMEQQQNHLLLEVENMSSDIYGFSTWKVLSVAISVILIIILISMVVTARRTSKLKV